MEQHEETQLLEVIIQHIQSFLDVKEAARTILISKSWYEAWLNRPNVELIEFPQQNLPSFLESPFVRFARNTLQRYEDLNLKIQSFKLLMYDESWLEDSRSCVAVEDYFWERIPVVIELTKKAINLGPTQLEIEFLNGTGQFEFILPGEVLEAESLERLSLECCCIDAKNHKISWSRLKSLSLCTVTIVGINNWDIISMCPLLEELILYSVSLVFKPVLGVNDFHKLKILSLKKVEICECFFHGLLSKFPHLKDLVIDNCGGYEEIQICSDSLEYISFVDRRSRRRRAIFDVPRIKKFKFSSEWDVPLLSFKTTSTEWESRVSIVCIVDDSSFMEVREFIQELSLSTIHLDLLISGRIPMEEYDQASDVMGVHNPPMVEELTIHTFARSSVFSRVLEDLFWICRPNFIVLRLWPSYYTDARANDFTKFLCNALIEGGNENRNISGLHDLEEVNVEFFEDDFYAGCRSLPCKTMIDASAYLVDTPIKASLQLRWGESI